MLVKIKDSALREASKNNADEFLNLIIESIKDASGNNLNADAFQKLNSDQITLWGYSILHEELMDGGFIQLIYNGYGPFFFDNPFAKAMRLWGLHDFSKILYKAKKIYDTNKDELTKPCSDQEFMARFEKFPDFDTLDDYFVEEEEDITNHIAHYVDENISNFIEIVD